MKKITLLFTLHCAIIAQVFAQSSTMTPMTYSTSGTGASWGNLSGIQLVDNNPAYVDLAQYPTCNNFMCYRSNVASFSGLGFSIPANAVLTGIEVGMMQRVSSPGGGIHDSVLTLALNGNAIGVNKASPTNWFDTPTIQNYGSSSDLWGTSLTVNDVNSSTFGLLYELTNTSYDQPASVDSLSITVYYTIGTAVFSQTSNPANASFINHQLIVNTYHQGNSNLSLMVINGSGHMVYQKSFSNHQKQITEHISAEDWNSGIYFVHLEGTEGTIYNKKLILVK